MKTAKVINGQIKGIYLDRFPDGKTLFPVEEPIPTFNANTHTLSGPTHTFDGTKVVIAWTITPLPPEFISTKKREEMLKDTNFPDSIEIIEAVLDATKRPALQAKLNQLKQEKQVSR